MTLFVREADGVILRIAAYQPTTVADYLDRLGGRDEPRYLPGRVR